MLMIEANNDNQGQCWPSCPPQRDMRESIYGGIIAEITTLSSLRSPTWEIVEKEEGDLAPEMRLALLTHVSMRFK